MCPGSPQRKQMILDLWGCMKWLRLVQEIWYWSSFIITLLRPLSLSADGTFFFFAISDTKEVHTFSTQPPTRPSFHMSSCATVLFPIEPKREDISENPGALFVLSIPLLFTVSTWITVEALRLRAGPRCPSFPTRGDTVIGRVVQILAGTATSILVFRVLELLGKCDMADEWNVTHWVFLIVGGTAAGHIALSLVAFWSPRASAFLFLLCAGGVYWTEWALRGGILVRYGAQPLTAIQQLLCLQSLAALCVPRLVRSSALPTVMRPSTSSGTSAPSSSSSSTSSVTPRQMEDEALFWKWQRNGSV